jgi:hypothetical protein
MDEPLNAIVDLLREKHGISPAKLKPSARLWHDLGVDGDDASDLLERLHERFGTDFSQLDWAAFFNSEGMPLQSSIVALASTILAGAVTICIGIALLPFKRSAWLFSLIYVAAFLILIFGANRLFPKKPKRPVTIAGLAEVVQDGAWPRDSAKVR